MLTTELKKSGSNDVVVQGKLIINVSSNIGNQSTNTRSLNPQAISHNRSPSVISAVSSVGGSSSTHRNSTVPATPSTTTNGQAPTGTPAAATTTPATNGGRQLSAYEDQHGPLPPKYVLLSDRFCLKSSGVTLLTHTFVSIAGSAVWISWVAHTMWTTTTAKPPGLDPGNKQPLIANRVIQPCP